jgi:hypothetical protein
MSQATDMLAKYLEAEAAVLAGQDVSFNGRRLAMADLVEIRAGRAEWEKRVAAEQAATDKSRRVGGLTFKVARFD